MYYELHMWLRPSYYVVLFLEVGSSSPWSTQSGAQVYKTHLVQLVFQITAVDDIPSAVDILHELVSALMKAEQYEEAIHVCDRCIDKHTKLSGKCVFTPSGIQNVITIKYICFIHHTIHTSRKQHVISGIASESR